jgi:hypothetical protein
MLVLLDSNVFFSALIVPSGVPGSIIDAWLEQRFELITCRQQIDEIRKASHLPKFRHCFHPHDVGILLNNIRRASVWEGPLPRRHQAADPADSYLLDLIEAAQPDYAVTGDRRSGLLQIGKLGRTKILSATAFSVQVLHL